MPQRVWTVAEGPFGSRLVVADGRQVCTLNNLCDDAAQNEALILAAPLLLRACERAHRNVCGTSSMGPNCDLALTLRQAINAGLGGEGQPR